MPKTWDPKTRQILDLVMASPRTIHEWPPSERSDVTRTLLALEARGLIRRLTGRYAGDDLWMTAG